MGKYNKTDYSEISRKSVKVDVEVPEVEEKVSKPARKRKKTGKVIAKKLNVRHDPVVKPNNIIGILNEGELVKIENEENPVWYRITYKTYEGYVMKKFIEV